MATDKLIVEKINACIYRSVVNLYACNIYFVSAI